MKLKKERAELSNLKNNASHLSGFNQAKLQHELYLIRGRVFLSFLRPTLRVSFFCFTLAILTINVYKHYSGNTLEIIFFLIFFRMPFWLLVNCQLQGGTMVNFYCNSRLIAQKQPAITSWHRGYKTLTGRQVWASALSKRTFTTYYYLFLCQNIVHKISCPLRPLKDHGCQLVFSFVWFISCPLASHFL